jgi:transcriptional regulator
MFVTATPQPLGTLRGHIARANPQWRTAKPDVEAMVLFQGPHAYVSPSLYPSKARDGKVVPTWNYIAIHAHGTLTFTDDAEALRGIVARLTNVHEKKRAASWSIDDAPADYIDKMLRAIVGFSLTITRLEGKWKVSQNRDAADRAGVRDTFAASDDHAERALAAAMPPVAVGGA